MSQIFRFCIRCQRMTLVKDSKCMFCNKSFLLWALKDSQKLKQIKNEKRIETEVI